MVNEWGNISAVLCCLALVGTLAAVFGARWFRRPESVTTGFRDYDRLPDFLGKLRPVIEEAGFGLLGLRREKSSEIPYLQLSLDPDQINAEYTSTEGEPDLFLTVPNYGDEEFYFLTTFRDGLALVTAGGSYEQAREEDRFDFLRLTDQSVSQILAEHRTRVRKRESAGHMRSGLTGRPGRDAACRILYSTPHFRARGHEERILLLVALAALWASIGVLALLGHPPSWEFIVGFWDAY